MPPQTNPARGTRATHTLLLFAMGLMIMLPLHGLAQTPGGQFGSWSEAEATGTARYGASAVFLEEDIYVFGGVKDTGGLSSMERYDLTSDAWSYEASLFAPRMDMAAATYDRKIWVFGGLHLPDGGMQDNYASPRTYSYDPATNEWSGAHAHLPTAVAGATAQVIGDRAYVAGGYECSERRYDGLCQPKVTDALQIYDFATDTWSQGSPLPTGVALASSIPYPNSPGFSVSGGATVIMDTDKPFETFEGSKFRNDLQSYNATTDSWTTCCGTPGNAARWVYTWLPGLGVVGAGTWYDGGDHAGGIEYHGAPPGANWQDIENPSPRTIGPAFATVGRELHVMGGYDVDNAVFRTEHFVYEVPEPPDDSDGDGVPDDEDQCPGHDDMQDSDGDGTPDGCDGSNDVDTDGDGYADDNDNCPTASNPDQGDADGDGEGDACDSDRDGDGVENHEDACPDTYGSAPNGCDETETHGVQGSEGSPRDGQATTTTPSSKNDADGDGVPDHQDVCPGAPDNADQDGDGVPDACDPTPNGAESTGIPGLPLAAAGLVLLAIAQVRRRW